MKSVDCRITFMVDLFTLHQIFFTRNLQRLALQPVTLISVELMNAVAIQRHFDSSLQRTLELFSQCMSSLFEFSHHHKRAEKM